MAKPLPKTILKPRSVGGDAVQPNTQSRPPLGGAQASGSIAAEAILKQTMDAHRLAGESPELKTFVFVDEAKELKGSKTLDRITADGRKYGLGIVLATQRETHISPDVLANTATKILLPVDVADIRKVASRFRFDAGRIANLGTFQALVRTGGTAVACTIKPFFQRQN